MRQDDQKYLAALEQWTPLIAKLSYKAAQRAAKIGSHLDQEDFKQELSMTLFRAIDAYDPNNESGAKLITFLHRAFYNEINKLLNRDNRNAQIAYTVSGDAARGADDEDFSLWGEIESDSERPADYLVMDEELNDYVRTHVSADACAVMDMLQTNAPFVAQQLEAYNEGVEAEHESGGIRRLKLDLNFPFICKMLGFSSAKIAKLTREVETAVATYGV